VAILLALATFGPRKPVFAADTKADKGDPAKAKAAIESAIEALGGQTYLNVKTEVATGVYTPFVQGRAGFPLPFVDTFIYPDKNRTEFGKKKTRMIQANAGEAGWKWDGQREVLEAQEAEEIRQFKKFVRANLDNVLRIGWKEPDVKLRYIGRTEIAPRLWAEGVAVDYPDGLSIEIFLDSQTHLPRISRYRDGAESGAVGSLVETHYHDVYLDFGGIKAPRTVDLYRDQIQTARLIYEDIRYNAPVDPKLFAQPASPKDIK
jgi:hypothetical protein